jgi:hypothetical protein
MTLNAQLGKHSGAIVSANAFHNLTWQSALAIKVIDIAVGDILIKTATNRDPLFKQNHK